MFLPSSLQQAQNLQQQLIAQARQAAYLAEQPYPSRDFNNSPGVNGGRDSYDSYAQQSHAQAQAQAIYQAQVRAQAQQQNPQQLASAYEQRHAAQQQIQANLRARSTGGHGGGGAPPLPPPGGSARFGFETGQEINELSAQLGRTSVGGGGGGGFADGRNPLRSGSLSPTGQERFAVGPRMSSPLSALHQPGQAGNANYGGLRSESPAGQQNVRGRQACNGLPPPQSLGSASSIWGGGGANGPSSANGNGSNATSPWQSNSQLAPPAGQQQTSGGRPTSGGNGASRFANTFANSQNALDARSDTSSTHGHSTSNSRSEELNAGFRSPTSSESSQGQNSKNGGGVYSNGNWSNDTLRPIYEGIGLGRPHAGSPVDRAQSMSAAAQFANNGPPSRNSSPAPPLQRINSDPYGRPVQQQQQQQAPAAAGQVTVLRQPIGPPSVPDELGTRNFASRCVSPPLFSVLVCP